MEHAADILSKLAEADGHDASLSELAHCLLEEFGGVRAFAQEVKGTLDEASGMARVGILRDISQIIKNVTLMEGERSESDMSDEELLEEARILFAESDAAENATPSEGEPATS